VIMSKKVPSGYEKHKKNELNKKNYQNCLK